jgi:uncharacterized protein
MTRRPESPFRIPVSDLIEEPGRRREVHLEAHVDWALELSAVDPASPLSADLLLESATGVLMVRGIVRARIGYTCHRCVAEWTDAIEVRVSEMLGVADDDGYPIEGDVADLEDPLRDAVLLALPLVPLCRPECAGLCAVCGADLNTGACPGHEDERESPFAALRGLLEP